jgi:hypothetical protein
MTTIIKDPHFKIVSDNVKPDAKHRIGLAKAVISDNVVYRIYSNKIGQIVLDPQVTIPVSELWLFKNKKALKSVRQGLSESLDGKAKSLGSFAEFV